MCQARPCTCSKPCMMAQGEHAVREDGKMLVEFDIITGVRQGMRWNKSSYTCSLILIAAAMVEHF